jgi:hypothetical protein
MVSASAPNAVSIAPERVAALRAHPRFAQAMRESAAGIASMYHGSRLSKWLMDDRGQLLFSYYVLYLHFTRDPADPNAGLTPTRMKSICKELDICGEGRAAAMLWLMRLAGYLAPDSALSDRRRRRLVPTPRLIELLKQRWHLHFAAMAPLFPDGEAMLRALDDPAFIGAFAVALAARFRAGFRFSDDPALLRLVEHNAGMMLFGTLVARGAADDTVPPARPVPMSISALARRFGASRVHVIKLLDDAAAANLIQRSQGEGNEITVLPRLAETLRNMFAAMYLYFADCTREAQSTLSQAEAGTLRN